MVHICLIYIYLFMYLIEFIKCFIWHDKCIMVFECLLEKKYEKNHTLIDHKRFGVGRIEC